MEIPLNFIDNTLITPYNLRYALVAKLGDAPDLGSGAFSVEVRVLSKAGTWQPKSY